MALKEKKKTKIIICVIIILIIIIALILFILMKEDKLKPVDHNIVENLYIDKLENNCSDITYITKNENIDEMDSKTILYLIFSQMDKEDMLKDNVSFDDYKKIASKITDNIQENFTYNFNGYKYTASNGKITKTKATCDKHYITKLYGFTGTDELKVNVKSGYIKDNTVYDLSDKEIGPYTKKTVSKLLDQGTMQVYNYKKSIGGYKLISVGIKWLNIMIYCQ